MEQLLTKIKETSTYLLQCLNHPQIGLVLGSGLGDLVEQIREPMTVAYHEIPHFPVTTVEGHSGRLVAGIIEGKKVLAMQGRFHYYEGYSLEEVTFPIRVMRELGIKTLIITNAAGGINACFQPGDIMLITDHINFLGLNPLRGPNHVELGPRFPDMTEAYSPELQAIARQTAARLGMTLREGIYAWVSGPSYETPAEVKLLGLLGADAVGMSTVPEVIVANHGGMQVLGLSCITNVAAGLGHARLDHEDVVATAEKGKGEFQKLISGIIGAL
ncbi:MAG: purine-nucleoside phosphorylase [Clostridia bacterium]|nr:purine-nucleoside phosphorylase [Clostridia bacterium]